MAEVQAKPGAQIAASPVPQQTAPAVVLPAGAASTVTTPELNVSMTDVVESQEFLLNPANLTVLSAPTREKFTGILDVVNLIAEHAFIELTPPEPSLHNELVSLFRNPASSGLPGALAAAIERSEEARNLNLARLTELKGYRVRVNLNLGHIPRLLINLSDVNNTLLTLVGPELVAVAPYRASVQNLTARVKSQQRALHGALLDVDRLIRLYGRHLLIQSYTNHFLRDDATSRPSTARAEATHDGAQYYGIPLNGRGLGTGQASHHRSSPRRGSNADPPPGGLCPHPHAPTGIPTPLPFKQCSLGRGDTLRSPQSTDNLRRTSCSLHPIRLGPRPPGRSGTGGDPATDGTGV